jgi:hypothetical protein
MTRLLRDLLAVIHCDDGSYRAEHGEVKATEDAIAAASNLRADRDSLRDALAALVSEVESSNQATVTALWQVTEMARHVLGRKRA